MQSSRENLGKPGQKRVFVGVWLAIATLTAMGYGWQHGRYYIHFMDDAWIMSWAFNLLHKGTELDLVFRGGDYTVVFGKTMQWFYGLLLDVVGWSKGAALWISTLLVWGTGVCWYFIGRRLGWSVERALILGFTLVLLDKVVEAGCLCRAEAIVLCLLSVSLLAFMHGRYFVAGLVAVASAEIHPIALTSLFYVLAWAITDRANLLADKKALARHVGWFVFGAMVGVAWYVGLHFEALQSGEVSKVLAGSAKFAGAKRAEWTYLDRHFKWHSHFELLVFAFALLAWLQQKLWKDSWFPLVALVCVVGSAFLNKRPNGFYTALAFPVFALISVHAFSAAGIARAAFVLLLLTFGLETRARVQKHPEFRPGSSTEKLRELVPTDGAPVVGMNDFWFVFPDRPFLPGDYAGNVHKRLSAKGWDKVYLIDSKFMSNRATFGTIKRHLKRGYTPKELGGFKEHGRWPLKVVQYTRK